MDIDKYFDHDEPLKSYMRLVQFILKCSEEDKKQVQEQWDGNLDWQFPQHIIPSHRLSYVSESLIEKEYSPIERAQGCLVSYWLENGSGDIRDDLVGWAIVYNELLVANERPRELFKRVGLTLGGTVGGRLVEFAMRKDADLGMEAFGLSYVRDPDGHVVKVVFGG